MKTKTFFILCLLSGIGLTQLSAQPAVGKCGNAIINGTFDLTEKVPLNCDLNSIVPLVGTVRIHAVFHFSNYDGDFSSYVWSRQGFRGRLVLEATKEVFKVDDAYTQNGSNTQLQQVILM